MSGASLDAALGYARRGWAVFPVESRGKRPACDHGKDDATTAPDAIARMFARPAVNVGIAVEPSGLVVVDVDDDERGGGATFAALVADLGPLPPTITADTPSGGAHFLFRAPGADLRGKAGPGVEIIARGYVVAAPSVHPSGRAYRWRAGCGPDDLEVADLPARWIDRLRRAVPQPAPTVGPTAHERDGIMRRATAYLAKLPPSISGQGGHDSLWDATLALVRGFDLDADDAFALLASEFNPRCAPPWSERELRHKIADASKAAVPAGYLLAAPRGLR